MQTALVRLIDTVRSSRPLLAAGVALMVLGVVVKVADSVRENDTIVRADEHVMRFVLAHRSAYFTGAARAATQLGSGWVVAPLTVVVGLLLLRAGKVSEALLVACSTVGAAVAVAVVKHVVGRARPPVLQQLAEAHGSAFPSGHSAQSIACFGALAWVVWSLGASPRARRLAAVAAIAIAVLIGVSRVYLGVHWMSDVVSGWLLGAGWLVALMGIWRWRGWWAAPSTGERTGSELREA